MLLSIQNLNIEFHDHLVPETVVHALNLELKEGEILGIVGESGSGKSMTALAIAGLLHRGDMKKSGTILFEGEDLLQLKRSELRKYQGTELAMIFQEPMTSLNPVKKIGWQVEENLRVHDHGTENKKVKKAKHQKKALEMLQAVGLSEPERVYDSYPHELSGGMRQRVMIAAAMINSPKLLIADEPTTALDVTVQAQIVDLLKELHEKEHMSILFISHDLSLVEKLCERVVVMQNGYVVETGNVKDIFDAPKEEYTKQLIAAIPKCEL